MFYKKLILMIVFFFIGYISMFFLDGTFRFFVQEVYLFHGDVVFFYCKDIHFPTQLVCSMFGIYGMINVYRFKIDNIKKTIKGIIFSVLMFFFSITILTFIDGKLKIISCTTCEDSIYSICEKNIKYDKLFVLGIVVASIPFLINIYKDLKSKAFEK